ANNPLEPVNGGVITFVPPTSGASANLSSGTATIIAGQAISAGQASVTATANGTIGAYTVSATATGAVSGPNFSLANNPRNVYWSGFAGDGNWGTAGNWSTNPTPQQGDSAHPGPYDAVIIDNRVAVNPFAVTHSAGTDSVYSLTSQDALVISGGTLSIAAASTINNSLTLSGAWLSGSGNLTVAGSFIWDDAIVRLQGSLTLNGATTIQDTYPPSRSGPPLGGTMLINHGPATATNTGVEIWNSGRFINAADGTLQVLNNDGFGAFSGAGPAFLDNYGRIETHGTGTTTFALPLTNNGPVAVIQADAGTLVLGDGYNGGNYDGRIQGGPGASVQFAGSSTFASTSSIDFDRVTFYGHGASDMVAGSYNAHLSTSIDNSSVYFTGTVQGAGALNVGTLTSSGGADFTPKSGGPVTLTLPSLVLNGGLSGTDGVTVNGALALEGGAWVRNAGG